MYPIERDLIERGSIERRAAACCLTTKTAMEPDYGPLERFGKYSLSCGVRGAFRKNDRPSTAGCRVAT